MQTIRAGPAAHKVVAAAAEKRIGAIAAYELAVAQASGVIAGEDIIAICTFEEIIAQAANN